MTDAAIEHTRRFAPEGGWRDSERSGGIGVRVRADGRLDITNFSVLNCDLAGIVIGTDGQVDLSIGRVCGHPIGVVVLPEAYDFSRLIDRVVCCDNERNLDTEALSIPDTASPLP